MLMGYRWPQVRKIMMLTHGEFNELLNAAVAKAHADSWQDAAVGPLGPCPLADHGEA